MSSFSQLEPDEHVGLFLLPCTLLHTPNTQQRYTILPPLSDILHNRLFYTLAFLKWWQSQGRTSPTTSSRRSKNYDTYTTLCTIARLRQNPAGRRRLRREYVRAPLPFIRRVYTLSYIQHCTALNSVPSLTKPIKRDPLQSQNSPHDMLSGASAANKSKDCHVSLNPSTPQSQDQRHSQKRKRRDNRYHRQVSMQIGNNNRTLKLKSWCRDVQTTLLNVGLNHLMNIASPSSGLTEEKFENLNNLSNVLHLHTVVLSEHQLSSTDTPSYVSRHGWEMHISRGPKKRGSRRSHNGGVALLVRENMFEVDSHPLITSQHQATLWTLRSTTLRHPFHITGVYSSPASGDPNIPGDAYAKAQQVRDLYQCLAEHNIESPTEVHLTVGDFNSHIGTEQENHITREEAKHVPIRQGDPHPAHQPIIALRDNNTTTNAKSRGRLLLNLLNSTSQLVANGRLESPQNPNFPATLTRTRTNESSNLISRTIVDYMIIGKQHWDSVRSCTIHRGSHLEVGSSPGNPTLEPCDHELIRPSRSKSRGPHQTRASHQMNAQNDSSSTQTNSRKNPPLRSFNMHSNFHLRKPWVEWRTHWLSPWQPISTERP